MSVKVQAIYDNIKDKGFKLTPARKIIINIFSQAETRLYNAAELFDLVRKENPKINFSTVYRNLEILVENQIVEKLSFAEGAKFKLREPNAHYHHMICKSCLKAEQLPYCPVQELEESIKEATDFLPTEHRVEVYGYCKDCQKVP